MRSLYLSIITRGWNVTLANQALLYLEYAGNAGPSEGSAEARLL